MTTSRGIDHLDPSTVRMPREIVEQIRKLATIRDRSLAVELRVALNEYLNHHVGERLRNVAIGGEHR